MLEIIPFKNEQLYSIEYQITLQMNALKDLIQYDENSMNLIHKDFETFVNEQNSLKIEEEYQYFFQENLIDKEFTLRKLEIQKRYSTLMLIYSVFESILDELCNFIYTNSKIKIKRYSTVKGKSDLARYEKYLTNIVKVDFSKLDSFYIVISKQKIVRNRVTHNNGYVKTSDLDEIQTIDGLEIKNKRIIITKKSYYDFLVETIKNFFEILLKEIDLKIDLK